MTVPYCIFIDVLLAILKAKKNQYQFLWHCSPVGRASFKKVSGWCNSTDVGSNLGWGIRLKENFKKIINSPKRVI